MFGEVVGEQDVVRPDAQEQEVASQRHAGDAASPSDISRKGDGRRSSRGSIDAGELPLGLCADVDRVTSHLQGTNGSCPIDRGAEISEFLGAGVEGCQAGLAGAGVHNAVICH